MTIQINGTSGISGVDGSATTPALQGTDTNTGITFGTDIVNVVTGGSTRATVDSSGNVGIGTSSPQVPLQIGGASGTQDIVLHGGNNTNARLRFREGGTVSSGFNEYSFGMAGAANAMTWETAGSERMKLSSAGRLDVFSGSATDTTILSSAASAGGSIELISGRHSASSTGTGTKSFLVFTNGNVQNTNNSYGSTSDIKLKENIVDASSQWDDLKAIQVRKYNFKEETGHQTHTQLGVVAQEVELVCPGLVTESPDRDEEGNDLGTTTKSVNYSVLYMKAVKALQEAMTRIEQLETRVAQLEGGAS